MTLGEMHTQGIWGELGGGKWEVDICVFFVGLYEIFKKEGKQF